ncbi:MarR family winged helix-turn-helix transcriptional regulator [Psychrobacillus lasiicapitis]|uniref:MarR family transcriptional regulator n=1 Tax=Psychrobacillus lasiicapitis TaxID=1636719 RepID=A0A544T8T6_9BACI|nr:MarR family transcriptional regulator [Psychrobacillus lasiicapitis]TQR13869.1 MarR family transcriptional regulator [Psychrobacillus lasiicapitis]GGA36120.1 putative HTH-type transcriptional regulator YsmB [Psychrobacillus lasiicapitis]
MADDRRNTEHNQEDVAFLEKELRHISGIIKQRGRQILNAYTITPPQFVALQWLLELGDMTIGDLSTKMYLAFSTTTDLIDRMERSELVQRVRDEQDRRVVRIHLLAEGERIIEEVIDKRQQYLKDILGQFNEKEVANLSILLEKLHQEMKKN